MSQQQPPYPNPGDRPAYANYPGQYPQSPWEATTAWDVVRMVLSPLASLKLTVVLFAVSILLILFGTLAQAEPGMDIWRVIDQYFRTWIAEVDLKIFTPKAFFPHTQPAGGKFWFPGGNLIGLLMALNLLSAHALRFTVQARGTRLYTGLGVLGLGCLATFLVIASGGTESGNVQDQPLVEWGVLWRVFQVVLALLGAGSIFGAIMLDRRRTAERFLLGALAIGILATLTWTLVQGESGRLSDPSMRILWQLLKGQFAASVLLVGCVMVFHKRGGVVLLHAGIGLLMISEMLTGWMAVESQMTIYEGEKSNYVQDIRTLELAVVRSGSEELKNAGLFDAAPLLGLLAASGVETASDFDVEITIPKSRLEEGARITDAALPFDLKVQEFFQNSNILPLKPGDENPADSGTGRSFKIVWARPGAGTDVSSNVDISSAYVTFYKKGTDEKLGTYLLSMLLTLRREPIAETVTVDGESYDLFMRYKRIHKPYTIHALDVHRENYIGTETPSDYSSLVRVEHPAQAKPHEVKIWMNNPLRAYGETFYQSGYNIDETDGREITTLQVVTNFGWMIPYVCCMIVGTGMFYQFWLVLMRFLRRRSASETLATFGMISVGVGGFVAGSSALVLARSLQERHKARQPEAPVEVVEENDPPTPAGAPDKRMINWIIPAAVLATFVIIAGMIARPPKAKEGEIDYYSAGKIPLVYEGRMKPLDTLARNSMLILSDSESFALYDVTLNELGTKPDQVKLAVQNTKPEPALAKVDDSKLPQLVLQGAPSYQAHALTAELEELGAKVKLKRRGQPAMRWLMELMSRPRVADSYPIFRIENPAVLDKLGLSPREGLRYAYTEFEARLDKDLADEFTEAAKLEQESPEQLDTYQRKLLEFEKKRRLYLKLRLSFTVAKPETEAEARQFMQLLEQLQRTQPPLSVPPSQDEAPETSGPLGGLAGDGKPSWEVFPMAWLQNTIRSAQGLKPNPYFEGLQQVMATYQKAFEEPAAELNKAENAPTPAEAAAKLRAKFNQAVTDYRQLAAANPEITPLESKIQFESYFNSVSPFFYAASFYLAAFVLTALSWLGWSKALSRAALWLICFTFLIHTFALLGRMYISGRPPVTNLYSSAVFIGWGMVLFGIVIDSIYRIGVGNIVASVAGFATLGIAHFLSGDGDTFVVMQAVLDTQFWLATHVTCITLGYATTYLAGLVGLIYIIAGVATPSLTPKLERDLYRITYGTLCFSLFFSFVGTVLGGLWADDSWGRFWGWDPKENGALIIVLWNALVLHARWDGMVRERGTAVLSVAGMMFVSWSWFGVNELGAGLHSYGFTEGVMLSLAIAWGVMLLFIGMGCLPKDVWWSFAARQQPPALKPGKPGRTNQGK